MKQTPTKLAVDIGGTFTDIALVAGNRLSVIKTLTTHDAPERGFLTGMATILKGAGIEPDELDLIVHGTTLATNALIERRGYSTGLITTEGFRDVLEIADEGRFDQYDLMLDKPPPLVPRTRRIEIKERVRADGKIVTPLVRQTVEDAALKLRDQDVAAVAIGLLHSYANPEHECLAREIVAAVLPDAEISVSHEVCPEIREYERISTTCANAYVQPVIASYLNRLKEELQRLGATCPLLLMTSGGGLTSVESACRFPIRLVESGPAGGAILAGKIAEQINASAVMSYDMGGTTAKICLISDFVPDSARTFEVARTARFKKGSGLPLRIPVIEMIEIGAGGGSIAYVNPLSQIQVGPESAESEPGPACYGRGGDRPTVTDVDVVLGRIAPEHFAGGSMQLVPQLASDVIEGGVANVLGLDVTGAAFGIVETIDETMSNAARVYSVERGKDLSDYTMVAFGGAAPLHAGRIAEKLRINRVVIPKNAGVGSALGFLGAPLAYENVRSKYCLLHRVAPALLNDIYAQLNTEAMSATGGLLTLDPDLQEQRHCYMRYQGQGHEIAVDLPARTYRERDLEQLRKDFEAQYHELFGRTLPHAQIEIMTFGIRIEIPNKLVLSELKTEESTESALTDGVREVFMPNDMAYVAVPVVQRSALKPGAVRPGPCLITESTTSTFVSDQFDAVLDHHGHLIMERKPV